MNRYFHFTLGPVQGFVAQARRTRDFWAGSFILSWLSAVAMREVVRQNGKILFPAQNDNYLKYLTGDKKDKNDAPQQGCVPNRFNAAVQSGFEANFVTQAVQQAWKALAESVWSNDKLDLTTKHGNQTREIWETQVSHFWEISWGITPDESDSNVLDRRKNWRTHFPPPQAGVKCMMMDGWLAGAVRRIESA